MKVPTLLFWEREPGADWFGLVGGQIVEHNVDIEADWYLRVDQFEK